MEEEGAVMGFIAVIIHSVIALVLLRISSSSPNEKTYGCKNKCTWTNRAGVMGRDLVASLGCPKCGPKIRKVVDDMRNSRYSGTRSKRQ